ncbi:MAG: plasmid stabilization protein [Chloroflexi bacterium]|nr:plasmid stabilization protein [Chloroflexota bacterium]
MASITIRNLDEELKQRLRVRAAERGHSMEQEAREILRVALAQTPETGEELVRRIRARFAAIGYVEPDELQIPPREPMREPPRFD